MNGGVILPQVKDASLKDKSGDGSEIPFLSGRNALECLLGGLGIFTLCMIGQEFYKVAGTLAAPLWPSSGLALGIMLLRGWRLFPAITLGTIAATQTFGDNPIFSITGSLANTLESLIGWFLMIRVFGFSNSMTHIRDIMVLILGGALWGTIVSAVICTLGLVEIGAVKPDAIPLSSLLFWTGNVLGIMVFTPLTLRLAERWTNRSSLQLPISGLLWFLILTGIVLVGFCNRFTAHSIFYPLAYLSFPLLVWLSVTLRKDVIFAVALVTTLATGFTAFGLGPLIRYDAMATYAEMTVFIIIYSLSCLILMAAMEEGAMNSENALSHRLDSLRKEAELKSIRTSLNPHFLFNSLNTIKSLTAENPSKAQEAIIALSAILRSSIRITNSERVSLREELAIITSYLNLQKIRHEDRLSWEFRITPGTEIQEIPPMLLHQLVENAVKHGVELQSKPSTILLETSIIDQKLFLRVTNDGKLSEIESMGLGFHSIKREIETLYGNDASFFIVETGNDSVVAQISLPCHSTA
jgi:integral membrane sensor domain MASE1